MLMFQKQQFELHLKQTCRVTFPSAVVGWTPFSQPVEHASHLFVGGHVVGIRVPAASLKRYQPLRELSHVQQPLVFEVFLSLVVRDW